MVLVPPALKKGDTIGIVCPSGYMALEKMEKCIAALRRWGFHVKMGSTPGQQFHYFSGTDEDRLADLQQMMDDSGVQAILCGRGGYGMSRIIDRLQWEKFRQQPKWIIGYSDITLLHAHLFATEQIASLHSPMAGAFNDCTGAEDVFLNSIYQAITGCTMQYSATPHSMNRPGEASGPLTGGNLSLLAHLIGSASDYDTSGHLLFIEDVGEYLYNIDRMWLQLKRSGKLSRLAGLIVGSFSDMKDTTIPFGSQVYDIILEQVKEYDYPVCFDFPVGHVHENFALKSGVVHRLQVGTNVLLSEVQL
ncbi:S66 peptidase family protein [Filimonas effusa]|uniref:LD-carboxypeptidase n=1 Tax=Filimonas effusa TaxID=2508721 RepID=A0A4Q1D5Z3_9BACT|nr:LD-carboxypeptidase [Filimonas effusa]RXK83057.1 LD-carboxypeptidase [Filimonas effusa]